RKPGKIDFINPHISQDIQEPVLCFVETIEDNITLWRAYAASEQKVAIYAQFSEPLKTCNNFVEALLWCYCNAILTLHTKLDIISKKISLQPSQWQQLFQTLKHWLPQPEKKPAHESFSKNHYSTQVL